MTVRNRRRIDGVILLDKPIGFSSNLALQTVKRLYKAQKAGHAGTLDPLASGLLPICLGEATKVLGFLLTAAKSYRFTCRLGVTTSTGDAQGEVCRVRPVEKLESAAVNTVLRQFIGRIEQTPPMYSALKHQGQRLYELARQGIEVHRQSRSVVIRELQLLRLQGELLECQLHCSKGTYVRTLVQDLGEALGCGAHVVELRRIGLEPYDASQMVTLSYLQDLAGRGLSALDAMLLPADTAIAAWPAVRVQGRIAHYLLLGNAVPVAQAPTQGWVRLYEGDRNRFVGIGEILEDGRVAPRRLIRNPA